MSAVTDMHVKTGAATRAQADLLRLRKQFFDSEWRGEWDSQSPPPEAHLCAVEQAKAKKHELHALLNTYTQAEKARIEAEKFASILLAQQRGVQDHEELVRFEASIACLCAK
jgi:hypothetical protein